VQDAGLAPNGTSHLLRCRFIYAATLDNLPDQHKADIFSRLTYALNNDTQLFAEASFARNHNIGRVAPVPIDQGAGHIDPNTGEGPHFAFPITSQYFPTALLTSLGFTPPFDTLGNGFTEIGMRAVPAGNRVNDNTNDQVRFVGGVKGTHGGLGLRQRLHLLACHRQAQLLRLHQRAAFPWRHSPPAPSTPSA
jgi:iron complex outermembrane receptor protein